MDETICPTIGWNKIPRTWSGNIKKMRGANLGRPGEKRGEKHGEKRCEKTCEKRGEKRREKPVKKR